MIDKRFWSSAVAVVTLLVAGAGALPELLRRPASTAPTIVLPPGPPKVEPVAKTASARVVATIAAEPAIRRAEAVAPPEQPAPVAAQPPIAASPELPKPEPVAPARPAPAAPAVFPPVQPVGVAAASMPDVVPLPAMPDVVPLPAKPPVMSTKAARPATHKPTQVEEAARRSPKPEQNIRPAVYPIGEFLVSRR